MLSSRASGTSGAFKWSIGVITLPGEIGFTLVLNGASPIARALVKPKRFALAVP